MSNPDPLAEPIFYIPGHINVVIEHEGEVPQEIYAIFKNIDEVVHALTPSRRMRNTAEPLIQTWTMSPGPQSKARSTALDDPYETPLPISMISWNLEAWSALTKYPDDDDNSLGRLTDSLIKIINDRLRSLIASPIPHRIVSGRCLPGYSVRSEGLRPSRGRRVPAPDAALPVETPDPLKEVQHGTGGPGAYPIAYTGAKDRNSLTITVGDENTCINTKFQGLIGQHVKVAVLDTAFHSLEEVQQFAQTIGVADHWLYDDLINRNPLLFSNQVFIQPQDEIYYMQQSGGDVLWRSHGFNVAGLIRLTAPDATISLYRVLNDHGIGSLQSILNGLKQALDDLDDGVSKVVINCSFTISEPNASDDPEQLASWPEDRKFIEMLFKSVTRHRPNVTFIAAAGNDGIYGAPEIERPFPRFPGASHDFAAIASLNLRPSITDGSTPQLTYYSNASTSPRDHKIGLAVFGGEAKTALQNAGSTLPFSSTRGLIVPHIESVFYEPGSPVVPTSNTTGFAQVAGTSFAAAVASGLSALLLSGPTPDSNPIRTLQAAKEDPNDSPDQGVRIFQKVLLL